MALALEVKNLAVAYADRQVVNAVSFGLKEGAIGCLLGPSGCGKTTLLRTIAGFEQPVAGEVLIKGKQVSSPDVLAAVEKRHVGMVFQDYALFPHLKVRDNIAFGLQSERPDRRDLRIREVSELLDVTDFLHQYPHQLSGGQQQRVALARAIAPRPNILLLDEPFASMDITLREQIARAMRAVLKRDGITAILVSHNQLEAFAMADEIGVIRNGQLLQWDTAFKLYHQPVSAYVADFIGEGVFLSGVVMSANAVHTELGVISSPQKHGLATGAKVTVLIRPDDILHDDDSEMQARVLEKAFRGAEFLYTLILESGEKLLSLVPSHHNHAINEAIGIRPEIDHLVVFPQEQLQEVD